MNENAEDRTLITLKIHQAPAPEWSRRELRIITKQLRRVFGTGPRAQARAVLVRQVFTTMTAGERWKVRIAGVRWMAFRAARYAAGAPEVSALGPRTSFNITRRLEDPIQRRLEDRWS